MAKPGKPFTKEDLVLRDGEHFHLRLNGQWHRHQTWNDAWSLLVVAGLDPYKMLTSATNVHKPVDIQYRPAGRHRWWLDGHPVPLKCVRYMLRESGCNTEEIGAIIRANKSLYEIEQKTRSS